MTSLVITSVLAIKAKVSTNRLMFEGLSETTVLSLGTVQSLGLVAADQFVILPCDVGPLPRRVWGQVLCDSTKSATCELASARAPFPATQSPSLWYPDTVSVPTIPS